jgi:hypothetical protein
VSLTHGVCPVCHQPCSFRGERISEHRTDMFVLGQPRGGRRRERCVYSGGTWADAKLRVTPLARRMLDRGYRKLGGRWVDTSGQGGLR